MADIAVSVQYRATTSIPSHPMAIRGTGVSADEVRREGDSDMLLDALGWTATGVFSVSYFFKQPGVLRKIQAAAAVLWIAYGIAIHSAPVVVANLIVGIAAISTSWRATRSNDVSGQPNAIGIEVKAGNEPGGKITK
jgi:hypothetical protein